MDGLMGGWMHRVEWNLLNLGNSIKFAYVINIGNLFYLKAVRRTNNHYRSVHGWMDGWMDGWTTT